MMQAAMSEPWAYEFYQLVRLLEVDSLVKQKKRSSAGAVLSEDEALFGPVGEGGSPRQDPVRFSIHPAMVFEPAAVKKLSLEPQEGAEGQNKENLQWQVAVNIMGLIGATGVLPFRYSELVLQRLRARDPAMKAFLEVFNHRTVSLLYRAWKKYRPAYSFETDALIADDQHSRIRSINAYSQMISGLCGLSQSSPEFNQPQGDWLNYAGVAAHRRCNEYTLKNVIYHHFGIKVRIHQFKGRWQRLDSDVVTRLAGGMKLGMNNQLGQNALLGERCWVAQNLFEVEAIDLDEAQFASLSPGSTKLKALYEFVKQRAGIEMDFDLSMKIKEKELPVAKIGRGGSTPLERDDKRQSLLGWNTRLHRRRPSDRKIRISISKYGMQYQL